MARINVSGYGYVNLPDSMSQDEQQAAIMSGIESGALKPSSQQVAETSEPPQPVTESPQISARDIEREQGSLQETVGGLGEATLHGLKRAGAGVGQLVSPIMDVMNPGYQQLSGQTTGQALQDYMQGAEGTFEEKYGGSGAHEFGALLGELGPSFLGGAGANVLKAPEFISKAAQGLPAIQRGLAGAGGIFGKGAAVAAPYGAVAYDPEYERTGLTGGLQKAAIAAPLGGVAGSAMAGLSRLPQVPAKLLAAQGGLTKSQAEDVIPKLKGASVGLGEAIESPGINTFEEAWLTKVPFSGVKKQQYVAGRALEQEGEDILSKFAPEYIGSEGQLDPGKKLLSSLEDHVAKVTDSKSSKYLHVDDLADKNNVRIKPDNLLKSVKEIKRNIAKSDKAWGVTPKSEQNTVNAWLDSFSGIEGGAVTGSNFKKGQLGDAIGETKGKFAKGQLIQIRNALKKDIDEGLSGDIPKEVKKAYQDAEKYYSEVYAPLNTDKDIQKFIKDGSDTDTLISHFLKTGKDDRANLLNKLVSRLPPSDRKILGRKFLDSAHMVNQNDEVYLNPKKMVSLYKKLGDRTKELLFPEKEFKDMMSKYSVRVNKSPSAVEALKVKPTGASTPEYVGLTALMGGLGGLLTGNPAGAAVMGGVAGTGIGANLLSKYMRSDAARDLYMKGLMQPMRAPSGAAANISGGLTGALGNIGGS